MMDAASPRIASCGSLPAKEAFLALGRPGGGS